MISVILRLIIKVSITMFIGPCYMKTFPRAVRYLEFAFFYKE